MDTEQREQVRTLLETVKNSPRASFYRDHFDKHSLHLSSESPGDFSQIPTCSWRDLLASPLSKRTYTDGALSIKIAHRERRAFLVGRTLDDIKEEPYGISCKRPLVAFSYSYESIEKGLWFYTRNILPLSNEENEEITGRMAAKYGIDAIVGDTATLFRLHPQLQAAGALNRVQTITVIDSHFDIPFLRTHYPECAHKLILELPETGAIALLCPESKGIPVFHAAPDTHTEVIDREIVLTRFSLLPTPLIRYQTGIQAREIPRTCSCASKHAFTLPETNL